MTDSQKNTEPQAPRTSDSDPLRIDEIRASGITIGVTMMPGRSATSRTGPDWARDLDADMDVVIAWRPDVMLVGANAGDGEANALIAQAADEINEVMRVEFDHLGVPTDDAFASVMTSRDNAVKPKARVLVVSDRGLQRAGLIAAVLLMKTGVSPTDAERIVNEARPDAITKNAQRRYLSEPHRFTTNDSRLRREQQAPGVIAAKALSDLLMRSGARRGAALERVSESFGWRNWSTMRSAMSSAGSPYPEHNRKEQQLHELLALGSGDADKIETAVVEICFQGYGDHMWRARARGYLSAMIPCLIDVHDHAGLRIGRPALYAALSGIGLDIDFMFRAGAANKLSSDNLARLMNFAANVPSYDAAGAMRGEKANHISLQQISYLTMQISKPLNDLADAWDEKDVRVRGDPEIREKDDRGETAYVGDQEANSLLGRNSR